MKIFHLTEICPNKELAQEVINRYEDVNFCIEVPQWIYINEFEPDDWASWWDEIYRKYNLLPGEQFTIIKE